MDASRPNKGNFKHCPKIGIQGQVLKWQCTSRSWCKPS